MTIDGADLRKRAERTFPQVYPSELTELLDAYEERDRLRAALDELKATIQSVCEAGHVDFPGLEILGEALGESDTALEGRE